MYSSQGLNAKKNI